jgi:hypothetical protein
MATYRARLTPQSDGSWIASAVALPHCWSRGKTHDEALARLRDEIRYRIELCPCSGVDDEYVQVELEVAGSAPQPSAASPAPPGDAPRKTSAATRSLAAPLSGALGCPPERARQPAGRRPAMSRTVPDPAPRTTKRGPGWRRWDD